MEGVIGLKIDMLSEIISTRCMSGFHASLKYCSLQCEGEHTRFDTENAATLMPVDAQIISLFIDSKGYTYAYIDDMYVVKMDYCLRNILPNDSVVYGFIFKNLSGIVVLGIFDACRVRGCCLLHMSCIDRFKVIHSEFTALKPIPSSPKSKFVHLHWVGHEGVLMDMMQFRKEKLMKVDFAVDCVLRLSDDLRHHPKCLKLLTKEPIVHEVPILSTEKMQERLHRKK